MSANVWKLAALTLLSAVLVGCATPAPPYPTLVDNIEALKRVSAPPVGVGAFTVKSDVVGARSIGLRADSMTSPVGNDFAAYLADALQKELTLAGKLNPGSATVISGQLLKNDIAAGGMLTNSGEIEARFVVRHSDQERYNAVHRVEATWDSSFLGGVAIPKARQQYPMLVQKLLSKLFGDSLFQAALQ